MTDTRERGTEHGTVVVEQWIDGSWAVSEFPITEPEAVDDQAEDLIDDGQPLKRKYTRRVK